MQEYKFIITLHKDGDTVEVVAEVKTEHSPTVAMYSAGMKAREYFEPKGYSYLGIREGK